MTEPFPAANVRGGQLPQNIFGGQIRGGDVMLQAFASIGPFQKQVSDTTDGPVIRRTNPVKADIQARLDNGDAEQTEWLRKIACQESGQVQFATVTDPTKYQYLGEPKMSTRGDGGAGVMQITDLPPTFAELWDWRVNVDKGKQIFAEKLARARNFPGQVREHPGFRDLVSNTNLWRQQNNFKRSEF